MTIFQNISRGLLNGFKYRRLASYIFFLQLFLSLLIGVLSYNYIQGPVGHSVNLFNVMDGYDHDLFQDLLRFEGTGWRMIKSFLVAACFIYLFLGPFIIGGMLRVWNKRNDQWIIFWDGGTEYFSQLLKINVVTLLLLSILGGLLAFFGGLWVNWGLESLLSEVPVLIGIATIVLFLIVILIFLIAVSLRAKDQVVNYHSTMGVFKEMYVSFKAIRPKFFKLISIGFIWILLSLSLLYVLNVLINCIPEPSLILVFLAFLLQLLVLYLRVCLRNGFYWSILDKA